MLINKKKNHRILNLDIMKILEWSLLEGCKGWYLSEKPEHEFIWSNMMIWFSLSLSPSLFFNVYCVLCSEIDKNLNDQTLNL